MLRNRSRAVTSKQALMADHHTTQKSSPTPNQTRSKTPSFFGSPKFKAFTQKGFSENDALLSPTSILDTKPFFSLTNPFSRSKNQQLPIFPGNKHHTWDEKPEAQGISLVLNDPFDHEQHKHQSQDQKRKVLFGTKLRVQIPALVSSDPTEFGTKTRNSHVSPCVQTKECSPRAIGSLDQHSEDYTCVISHGPAPRTTHIFDNCVVETYCYLTASNNDITELPRSPNRQPRSFLSFCHTCDKNLQQKIDIFIYRGEKAFCSRECRHREMVLDGMENGEFDDHFY